MALSFQECRVILDQFKRAHPEFLMRGEVHGLQVVNRDNRPIVVVLVTEAIAEDSLRADEKLPESFTYEFEDHKETASVELTIAPVARAHVGLSCHPGDPASGDPSSYYGTLGWNLYLNNVLVCLSNWHVFCARGNDTALGSPITINNHVEASLYVFQPLYSSGNAWDFALAQYVQPSDAAGVMRQCDDGGVMPYPGMLSPAGSVVLDGSQYFKVGARGPTCRTGTLIGVGDRRVKYEDGFSRSFTGQLIFSKMTDAGDSGAVIVRQSDTTVTGLNFAGNNTETIANPIFLAGWQRKGSVRFEGGVEIPMFTGSIFPPGPAIMSHYAGTPMMSTSSHDVRPDDPFSVPTVADIPDLFSKGKLFLGAALKASPSEQNEERAKWIVPPPVPVRPGVNVDVFLIRKFPGSIDGSDATFNWVYQYLCFG